MTCRAFERLQSQRASETTEAGVLTSKQGGQARTQPDFLSYNYSEIKQRNVGRSHVRYPENMVASPLRRAAATASGRHRSPRLWFLL